MRIHDLLDCAYKAVHVYEICIGEIEWCLGTFFSTCTMQVKI